LHSTAGQLKAAVMANRLKDINPELQLTVLSDFIKEEKTIALLQAQQYDYAVDCIDTLSPKVWFIKACVDRQIPIVSSLGAGGKIDPLRIEVTDISKSYQCNLARYVRKYLNKLGVRQGVKVVFSPEEADQSKIIETEKAYPKKSIIGTVSYMPAVFGCVVASVVIRDLSGE
jgi:tRNA threonylcarbamoyladenosine dehydratase